MSHSHSEPLKVETYHTTPYDDQKPGTSGLRKKVTVFQQPHYLENFTQAIFDSLSKNRVEGCTLLVSGDGRYYSDTAIHTICEIAAANGVQRVWIGKNGLVSTPAASAIIREREGGCCYAGILLTASHNPGGPSQDFGVKLNIENGGPAPESVTDKIYGIAKTLKQYRKCELPPFQIDQLGIQSFGPSFSIEVIDAVHDWLTMMTKIFDIPLLRALVETPASGASPRCRLVYDALNGVAGPYAKRLLVDVLRAPPESLLHCDPKPDFGGLHPDPNLTYASELVKRMGINPDGTPANAEQTGVAAERGVFSIQGSSNTQETRPSALPDFGAAGDGDNDRNMILGKNFFVTPSDSVAVIASYATKCIPYFRDRGIQGLSRSMPTSRALDNVAKKLQVELYETPTGWKYFGNLMDANRLSICGEESFGTGSNHIREKDGLWAVLAWLSILAYRNRDPSSPFVSVEHIVKEFWKDYGRNYYTRYDYEQLDLDKAHQLMRELLALGDNLSDNIASKRPAVAQLPNQPTILSIESFTYRDPVDGTVSENQGIQCVLKDGSRIVWRLSGTGSVGATLRIYIERYEKVHIDLPLCEAIQDLARLALALCDVERITGRTQPTVIT